MQHWMQAWSSVNSQNTSFALESIQSSLEASLTESDFAKLSASSSSVDRNVDSLLSCDRLPDRFLEAYIMTSRLRRTANLTVRSPSIALMSVDVDVPNPAESSGSPSRVVGLSRAGEAEVEEEVADRKGSLLKLKEFINSQMALRRRRLVPQKSLPILLETVKEEDTGRPSIDFTTSEVSEKEEPQKLSIDSEPLEKEANGQKSSHSDAPSEKEEDVSFSHLSSDLKTFPPPSNSKTASCDIALVCDVSTQTESVTACDKATQTFKKMRSKSKLKPKPKPPNFLKVLKHTTDQLEALFRQTEQHFDHFEDNRPD